MVKGNQEFEIEDRPEENEVGKRDDRPEKAKKHHDREN